MKVRRAAVGILGRSGGGGPKPGEAVHRTALEHSLTARDRRLLSQLVFGVIRHRIFIDYLLERHLHDPGGLPEEVMDILRVGSYQLLLCRGIPDHAAIHTAVEMTDKGYGAKMSALTNAVLRKVQEDREKDDLFPQKMDPVERIAIRHSFSRWMAHRWAARFGHEETEALMAATNSHPPLSLRVNTLLTDRESLVEELKRAGIGTRPGTCSETGLILDSDHPLEEIDTFRRGHFSVQDEAFQLIGTLLPPAAGPLILDAFAGLGGKSTHLSQRTGMGTLIVSSDRNRKKLAALDRETARMDLKNILPVAADARHLPFPPGKFDAIILDVPCSGTGVIRRQPDIKWNRKESDLSRFSKNQYRFLEGAAGLLKKGGHLLYISCSMEPEENEEVVMLFLKKYDRFHIEDLRGRKELAAFTTPGGFFQSFPHRHSMDGAFAALLRHR